MTMSLSGKRSRPPRRLRPSEPTGGRPQWPSRTSAGEQVTLHPASDDVIARLDRLEAIATAIAEHLGVSPRDLPGRRSPALGEGATRSTQGTAEAAHAVVRTVARRLLGRVKLYNALRGYGFVASPEAPGDVFFHRTDCQVDPSTLDEGAEVAFDLVEMANGQSKAVRLGVAEKEQPHALPVVFAGEPGAAGRRPAVRGAPPRPTGSPTSREPSP